MYASRNKSTCVSLLESDSDIAASDAVGGNAYVRVVQMLQGHLIYDCRLSDLKLWKIDFCQSGRKKVQFSCVLINQLFVSNNRV